MTRVLLINPKITSKRNARFPLSLLALARALDGRYSCPIIDGNVERRFGRDRLARGARPAILTQWASRSWAARRWPRPSRCRKRSAPLARDADHVGRLLPDPVHRDGPQRALRRFRDPRPGRRHLCRAARPRIAGPARAAGDVAGLGVAGGRRKHRAERRSAVVGRDAATLASYELLGDPRRYLARTFLGQRTVAHQAAIGCRFRCTFCGVAAMFRGATALPAAACWSTT